MALKKYRHLSIYRAKMNQLLNLLFPDEEVQEMELLYSGGEGMEPAKVIFNEGKMKGVVGGIHNYVVHIDIPEDIRESNSFFRQSFDFHFSEMNTWVKSSGKRINIYPRDRNEFEDNEVDLERRAYYFVMALQVALKWVEQNME